MFCTKCGKAVEEDYEFCPFCGASAYHDEEADDGNRQAEFAEESQTGEYRYQTRNEGVYYDREPEVYVEEAGSYYSNPDEVWCNKWISLAFCLLLGVVGAHRFYERKIFSAIAYIFTGGFCGIGVLVDLVIIATRPTWYRVR